VELLYKGGAEGAPPIPFIVDRPFVSVIRGNATDAILFVGHVIDPSLAQ
jgi:serine protease inhibitor